ncbi:MAG: medium chain dehydrogenase/reductase family protein [Anaerolineae bacterium]|nr:medium chain dehydrogenase/reductase family protein [Anaerolineae bacterium]
MNTLPMNARLMENTAVTTHQRAILTGIGEPERLQLVTEARPEPQAGEVRVKVLASGVAFADVLCRRGLYPMMPKLPFTPGYDLVGVVDEVGASVATMHRGQRVAAMLPKFGANAEYVCVPAAYLVPAPDGVDPVVATAVILNYLTAHRLLHDKTKAQPGERLLVHSAAGGVGTAVLQLGRALGLELYGTASKGKLELVARLGATPIDYQTEDFAARIRQLTGDGVDIVCDPVGGETLAKSYRLLRRGGRLVNYGMFNARHSGKWGFARNMARLVWYSLQPDGRKAMLYGNTPSLVKQDTAGYRHSLTALFAMLAEGRIAPIMGPTLPLSDIAAAHHLLETGAVSGKIILTSNHKL